MEEFPKNQENEVGENTGVEVLTEMPAFEEHMGNAEKEAPIGEKYYEQARAERDRWVEISRQKLERAEKLNPATFVIIEDLNEYIGSSRKNGFRPLDTANEKDVTQFNTYKNDQIKNAKEQVREDEEADLDELAECFKHKEAIDKIGKKLEDDEGLTEEELEYIGDGPKSIDNTFWDPEGKFMTPDIWWQINHGIIGIPDYRELLKGDSGFPQWEIIAKAQMREMVRQDQALLASNEEIQDSLENMEERRNANPFAGETNINSETGEARTFSLEDNYPRLENESEEDYANRLKRIGLKTRLFEKRQ